MEQESILFVSLGGRCGGPINYKIRLKYGIGVGVFKGKGLKLFITIFFRVFIIGIFILPLKYCN